jgi:hypothetical protein
MQAINLGTLPASSVLNEILHPEGMKSLTHGRSVCCFALAGPYHSEELYSTLIRRSADIDVTCREFVEFVVFYGDGFPAYLPSSARSPRPLMVTLNGISTSGYSSARLPKFSAELRDRINTRPGSLNKVALHRSMSECTSILLDHFHIADTHQPCLLFVAPDASQHLVVELDRENPLRSLMNDVLAPLSAALRTVSGYHRSIQKRQSFSHEVGESKKKIRELPTELASLEASLQEVMRSAKSIPKNEESQLVALEAIKSSKIELVTAQTLATLPHQICSLIARAREFDDRIERARNDILKLIENDPKFSLRKSTLERTIERAILKKRAHMGMLQQQVSQRIWAIRDKINEAQGPLEQLKRRKEHVTEEIERSKKTIVMHEAGHEQTLQTEIEIFREKLRLEDYPKSAFSPENFRVFDVIVHVLGSKQSITIANKQPKSVRVLLMAANPKPTSHIDLELEIRTLQEELSKSVNRDSIDLKIGIAAYPEDLIRLLREHRPNILHFSGHGTNDGLVFRSRDKGVLVTVTALAKVLLDRGVELVVLNACFSDQHAELLLPAVRAVIGTTAAVEDDAAIRFAGAFYRTLADGHTIRDSLRDARDNVVIHNLKDVFQDRGDLDFSFVQPSRPTLVSKVKGFFRPK